MRSCSGLIGRSVLLYRRTEASELTATSRSVAPLPCQVQVVGVSGMHQVEAAAGESNAALSCPFGPNPGIDLFVRKKLRAQGRPFA